MTISDARAALPRIVQRVGDGDEVAITRHGKPVAVVVRPDVLRVRRAESALAGAAAVGASLADGRERGLRGGPPISEERAEEMVAELRSDRARS